MNTLCPPGASEEDKVIYHREVAAAVLKVLNLDVEITFPKAQNKTEAFSSNKQVFLPYILKKKGLKKKNKVIS